MNANMIYLELHVPNFEVVKEFYTKLGFSTAWERKPEGRKGYLVMKKDGNFICFWPGNDEVYSQNYFKSFPKNTPRGYGVEIVIPVDKIEDFYDEISKFATIAEPLQIKPWGLKDFRITDPFGFYLRFTELHDISDGRFAVE